MQCTKCRNPAITELKHLEPLCKRCFCEVIEKRIRKYTRLNKSFRRGDRILITDKITEFIATRIIFDLPIKFFTEEFSLEEIQNPSKKLLEFISENKISKIVVPWTADDEACSFLHLVFNNNIETDFSSGISHKIIKILSTVTNKETELYSEINRMEFTSNTFYPDVRKFLDSLEEIYPDTKFGIAKSREIYMRK